jgi:hypothetical protein
MLAFDVQLSGGFQEPRWLVMSVPHACIRWKLLQGYLQACSVLSIALQVFPKLSHFSAVLA